MHALAVGFGLGFFVAIQVGPMSLFLIRSTLRRGWRTGLAIGAGIAVIDTSYCIVGVAGAGALLAIHPLRLVLGLVSAAVLVILGVKTLWSAFRVRIGGEVPRIESKTSGAVLIVVGGALGSATWLTTLATGMPSRAAPSAIGCCALPTASRASVLSRSAARSRTEACTNTDAVSFRARSPRA